MRLDRWLALIFLVIAIIYGVSAFQYPLLPFERNLPVLPNTLPKGLSILAALIDLFILVAPRRDADGAAAGSSDSPQGNEPAMQLLPTAGLVLAMVLYALVLRPVGFVLATLAFIAGTATMLGERRWHILLPVAISAALVVWLLVQQVLGIYLKPWPGQL